MPLLYLTADSIGSPTGGGKVTQQEMNALVSLEGRSSCSIGRETLTKLLHKYKITSSDPWCWDDALYAWLSDQNTWLVPEEESPELLAHFYAGTFSKSASYLKSQGFRVSWTAAAHSIEKSKKAHEAMGFSFDQYPHLTNPELWKNYVQGYLDADLLICPSRHSADVMYSYGFQRPIRIISHGTDIPPLERLREPPHEYRLGYMGSMGADKNVVFLLRAWAKLGYRNATLVLAGRDSRCDYIQSVVRQLGISNIELLGWVDDITDFYNQISCLCQASVSEGFGIEILEAMAHQRPVLCSTGAGACDIVPSGWSFDPENLDELCQKIDLARTVMQMRSDGFLGQWRIRAEKYTWDKVREMYIAAWKDLLAS